jgi:hypothetical protein
VKVHQTLGDIVDGERQLPNAHQSAADVTLDVEHVDAVFFAVMAVLGLHGATSTAPATHRAKANSVKVQAFLDTGLVNVHGISAQRCVMIHVFILAPWNLGSQRALGGGCRSGLTFVMIVDG